LPRRRRRPRCPVHRLGSGYAAAASRAAEYAAVVTIRDTASADAANAATDAVDALAAFGAGLSHGFNLDATAFGANPVVDAFWAAVSIDATGVEEGVEEGVAASVIAESPLWPLHPIGPEALASLWQDMKAALRAEKQDWQVWTIWYDDRLAGYPFREEERELAYVRIDEPLWAKGPAIVNAEIKRRIEEFEPPQSHTQEPKRSPVGLSLLDGFSIPGQSHTQYPEPSPVPDIPAALPAPIENVPSAVSFGWTSRGTITVVAGQQNWPVLPFKGSEQDHANRLEACRVPATDTARSLRSGEWNARREYGETLDDYVAYLPRRPDVGNFLLADAQARIIRAMFAADVKILPPGLAAKLQIFLEQHIGLRAYYPATEEFYESVRSGHLETPLPMDAVQGFVHGVKDNTPTIL
jgi:hypothetical protein